MLGASKIRTSLFRALPVLFVLLMATACGNVSFLSETKGSFENPGDSETPGEIYYAYDSDEDGFEEGSPLDIQENYQNGGFDGNNSNKSYGDENYYNPPIDDPIDIPVTIGKCETTEPNDSNQAQTNLNSVYSLMMSGNTNNLQFAALAQKTQTLKLTGAPGTYRNVHDKMVLFVLNLNTGKSELTGINDDGSFDAVQIQTKGLDNTIWVAAFDGKKFQNPVVFLASEDNEEDDEERCLIPEEDERHAILEANIQDLRFTPYHF